VSDLARTSYSFVFVMMRTIFVVVMLSVLY